MKKQTNPQTTPTSLPRNAKNEKGREEKKRINFLAQEKEMNAETKAVMCRDEERANKKSHYYWKKSCWVEVVTESTTTTNKTTRNLSYSFLSFFRSFKRNIISYSFWGFFLLFFFKFFIVFISCESIEKACFSLLVPQTHTHTHTYNIYQRENWAQRRGKLNETERKIVSEK